MTFITNMVKCHYLNHNAVRILLPLLPLLILLPLLLLLFLLILRPL